MLMKCLKFSLVAVAMASIALSSSLASANSLTDPGFEDPAKYTFDGAPFIGFWEGFAGSALASSSHSTVMPNNGTGHSDLSILGDDNSFAGVFQDIAAAPGQQVDGSMWHKTPDLGTLGVATEFRIEWHDAGGGEVSRVTNDGVIPTNAYSLLSVGGIAPAGTTAARLVYAIQTFGGEPDGGVSSSGTVFLDDASLVAIPEPASIALMGLAGLAIASMRRRK